jgi:hypothetical protein
VIWLTWRQFRAQAIVAGAALVAVAIALLATGMCPDPWWRRAASSGPNWAACFASEDRER